MGRKTTSHMNFFRKKKESQNRPGDNKEDGNIEDGADAIREE